MSSPLNIEDMEGLARERLPREVFDYYSGGAWDLQTLQENRNAYRRLRIHYRVLRDVSNRSTACQIFGFGPGNANPRSAYGVSSARAL